MKKLLGIAFLFLLPVCVNAVSVTFTSSGTISDGDVYECDTLSIQNSGTIVGMSGGQIIADNMFVRPQSTFNIFNGTIDAGQFVVEGCLNMSGGDVTIDRLKLYSTSVMNVFCIDYNFDLATQVLAGHLLDSSFFTIGGVTALGYEKINFIPEPISIVFFGLGLLALRRRK
jgi:cytoskeletal protein CcmA (bactofilin family)